MNSLLFQETHLHGSQCVSITVAVLKYKETLQFTFSKQKKKKIVNFLPVF